MVGENNPNFTLGKGTPLYLAPEAWHVNDDGSIKLGANLRHLLRPETIESVFWMYRATGKKQKWLDAAARLWAAFRRYAPVAGGGLATLGDVRQTPRPPFCSSVFLAAARFLVSSLSTS